jgi:hypothetical protein
MVDKLVDGFYWISIDGEEPEIARYVLEDEWWYTTGWEVPIHRPVKILSDRLVYEESRG